MYIFKWTPGRNLKEMCLEKMCILCDLKNVLTIMSFIVNIYSWESPHDCFLLNYHKSNMGV